MKNHLFPTLFLLFSCSNPTSEKEHHYFLPETWDNAVLVTDFEQKSCNEDMTEVIANPPKATAKLSKGNLIISYPLAHFRCDQPVQAVKKVTNNEIAILIQPKNMNPLFVAKCDCGYNLFATIPMVDTKNVLLFHRNDTLSGDSKITSIPMLID